VILITYRVKAKGPKVRGARSLLSQPQSMVSHQSGHQKLLLPMVGFPIAHG
jgi:hypothetical protein